jgi:hypothetical protein
MPVRDRRGKPLPPTHPFATPRVLFGQGRPQRPAKAPQPEAPTLLRVDDGGGSTSGEAPTHQRQKEGGSR